MPYMQAQLIANTVHLLLALGIFPMKEFEDCEAVAVKTWLAPKMFVHGAYGRHLILVQLRDMSGLRGYAPAQNMYTTLTNGFKDTDDDTTTEMIKQTAAAAMTGRTLGGTFDASQVPSKVATLINQLSVNQTMLLQQMAAILFNAPLPTPALSKCNPCRLLLCQASCAGLPLLLGVATIKAASTRAAGSIRDTAVAVVIAGDVDVDMARVAVAALPLWI
jgi:hypothetical protein